MAQRQNVQVNLQFTADTGKARAQLQELQTSLQKLIVSSAQQSNFGINKELQEASKSAAQLQYQLEKATNVQTGKLDLGKFSESLKQSGKSLKQYQQDLSKLGAAGDAAFEQLAQSVMSAEMPLKRTNKMLDEFWANLKKTAGWTISSSIINNFQGALQKAYGYAQDLNKSLNDIRIVTGYSTDQMAEFAKNANTAAKALSTTTTNYTNASLIYYQQGLTDQEVIDRTNVTVKMANAAGVSAEEVSQQLTAVWNNFYDGSKSLEYYADVMTALGAATASSTDEISEGLEKFASVADTIGLSYEYATASLATITATTRESANVVGTALKTLFSRIQGLSLGETLDDGTDLNKYSDALNKVGISIFDQNHQLKEMDDILDEMGNKWDTLAQDQKMALAQTVAGVRQYTQLITLMDNWDYFQENLGVATGATGALDTQADIYAESWEAANKRIQASAESIYDALLNDEFFIKLTNFGADVLDTIKEIIDSMGGVEGVLLTVGAVATRIFNKQIAQGLRDTAYQVRYLIGAADKDAIQQKENAGKLLAENYKSKDPDQYASRAIYESEKSRLEAQQAYIKNASKLSEEERRVTEFLFDQQQALINQSKIREQQIYQEKEILDQRRTSMSLEHVEYQGRQGLNANQNNFISTYSDKNLYQNIRAIDFGAIRDSILQEQNGLNLFDDEEIQQSFSNFSRLIDNNVTDLNQLKTSYEAFLKSLTHQTVRTPTNLAKALEAVGKDEAYEKLIGKEREIGAIGALTDDVIASTGKKKLTEDNRKDLERYIKSLKEFKEISDQVETETKQLDQALASGNWDKINEEFSTLTNRLRSGGDGFEELSTVAKAELSEIESALKSAGYEAQNFDQTMDEISQQARAQGISTGHVMDANIKAQGLSDSISGQKGNIKVDWADLTTSFTSLSFSIGSTITSFKALFETLNDGKADINDFLAITMSLGQIFETIGALKNVKSVLGASKLGMEFAKIKAESTAASSNVVVLGKALASTLGPALPYVAGIAAALAAIGIALGVAYHVYNKENRELEKTTEILNELKTAAEETKQQFESLKNSFDNYDSINDTLKSCVKGTQEWKDSLKEANDEVLTMLELYPELANQVKIIRDDSTGYLRFDEQSLKNFLDTKQRGANVQDYASILARSAVDSASLEANLKYQYTNPSLINVKTMGFGKSGEEIREQAIQLAKLSDQELRSELTKIVQEKNPDISSFDQQEYVNLMVKNADVLRRIVEDFENAHLAMEQAIDGIVASELDGKFDSAITEASTSAFESINNSLKDDLTQKYTVFSEESFAEFRKQYEQATGTRLNLGNQAWSAHGKEIEYIDNEGNKKSLSKEAMIETIAASQALANLNVAVQEATSYFNQFSDQEQAILKGYTVNNNFDNISQNKIEVLRELSKEELSNKYDLENYTKNVLKLSEEESQEYITDFYNSLHSIDFNDIFKDISGFTYQAIKNNTTNLEQLSANEQSKIANWVQVAYETSGKEGANQAASAFNNLINNLGEDASKLDDAFESIDWDSIENVEDLKNKLIDLDIPVQNLTDTELQALIDALYEVGEAAGFAANATRYAALQDIKDAVNSGNNLSKEQFKEIPDTLKHMFEALADGTYKFTGALADFNAEMDKASEADHKKRIADLQSDIEYLESLDENTINEKRIRNNAADANNDTFTVVGNDSQAILRAQLGYLKENGFVNADRYSRELIDSGGLTKGQLDEIAAELDKLPFAKNGEYLKSLYKELEHDTNAVLASQKNLNKVFSTAGTTETKKMAAGLVSVASEYESCQDEINRYHQLVAEGKEDTQEAAQATLDLANALHAAEFDKAAKDLTEYQEKLAGTSGEDAVKLASEMAQTFNELFGTTIDSEFILAQQDLIDKISKATGEEQKRLIANLEAQAVLKTQETEIKLTLNSDQAVDDVDSVYTQIADILNNNPITIDVNGNVDFTQVFAQLQALGIAGTTVANILTGLGATKFTMVNPTTGSTTTVEAGWVSKYQSIGYEITGATGLNTNITPTIPDIPKTGGGSGPSKYKKTSKDEILDRYKEEDDRLDDINDALEDYNRLMDRSYGQGRLNQMAKLRKALDEEKKAIEAKKAKALEYLQVDKKALEQTAKQHGVDFNIDDNGNITNYTETMENLFKQLEAAEAKANSFTSKEAQDKYIEASITPIKTKIEELKEVIAQYEETRELIEDLENEWEEVRDKEYANNYAELSYKIELRVELNEMDMDLIEYRIAQLGEGFFKSEEILALMGGDKLNNLTDGLKVQQDAFNDLQSAIEKDEITQADYVEGLKEAYQSTMDLANAVLDLDKEMLEYYSNTLDKANEELDKYTNNLEYLTGVLDHYKNIMGIIGKETDYEAMGKIMDARVITTRNELDIAKKNYVMMAEEVDKWAAKMNEATGEKELELYTKNWEAANEKMQEAQDEMLSKTEAWAEAMREQIENALSLENRNLEKILTGEFDNFDSLISSMDRAQSLQDNYLTETNKIYELDKLVNKAQQEIDKTNNQIAKQKLKAYMEETEELENVNQLSKYNLEIQQAKLDLVLAEIALEEAQNAKSVVRLSRDSEGNYGYVYTADQNKVSQAEQDFADAQNKLYNIGLRGSTEFAEKYAQTLQEMYDTLGQLQEQFLNGEFESEEQYNQKVIQIKNDYFNLLKSFQDDYTRSFTTHDKVRTESWGTSYETMINSTQEWEEAVNQNIENVSDQFSLWEELSTEASENIKDGLDEVTESSEALTKQIEDEILPAIEDEIDLVGDLTAEYAELRDELVGTANDYLELAEAIREALAAEQNKDRYEKSQKDIEKVKDKETGDATVNNTSGGDPQYTPNQGTGTPTYSKYIINLPKNGPIITYGWEEDIWALLKDEVKKFNNNINSNHYTSLAQMKGDRDYVLGLYNQLSFDTGGYTGVWGSDGRWALLHQKELVLNQEDTSNILSAVGIIRHIIDSIDLQSAYQRLAAPSASFFGAVSGGQAIDQNVSIEATFPNVQDRHEIEEAFNNLINTASQYAFRK